LYEDFCISKRVSRLFSVLASSSSDNVFSKYSPIYVYEVSMMSGDDLSMW
jgi:hypothetical protein